MTPYEIPLTSKAEQFFITLNGVAYSFLVTWNEVSSCWVLDISLADGTPLLLSVPLVTGTDLLGQYEYLGFGGSLYVQSDADLNRVPQYDELGNAGHLYFVVP